MLWITRLSVGRPLAVVAIFVAVVISGLLTYLSLPINQLPSVNIPVVSVVTPYPGAGPGEVELQVTRVIEDALSGLSDLDVMTSTSAQGTSAVTLTFTDKANNDLIATTVERQVQSAIRSLPTEADQPTVTKVDLNQLPVMQLAVVGEGLPPEELYRVADEVIRPQIERIGGVSQVGVIGGRQQEIEVEVDPGRLAGRNLSIAQIQQALAQANAAIPAGAITDQGRAYNLRVTGLFASPEDLAAIVVAGGSQAPIRLGDVATVTLAAKDQTQVTRVNGRVGVLLRLGQQNGANTTDVTDAVQAGIPQIRASLPAGSDLVVVQDNSTSIRTSINGVRDELIIAVLFTALVLLIFLHSFRVAAIVLLSIPTTLLAAFIAMRLLGFSLNALSTLGLTLSIGILVDDSIVILENILRRLGRGDRPDQAAINGRAEIGLAALAITLVDVVIFAPVGLVSGQIGGFFKEFGFTVAAVTLLSLVVSFTLTPMLASRLLHAHDDEPGGGLIGRYGAWWDRGFHRLERGYGQLMAWSIAGWHRFVVLAVAFLSLALGVVLIAGGTVGIEFFPQNDQGTFSIDTTAPPGTSLAAHDAIMRQIEARVLEVPEVHLIGASIGASSGGFGGGVGQATNGTVTVNVGERRARARDVTAIVADVRQRLADIPNVKIRVQQASAMGGGGQPVSVRFQGPDTAVLAQLSGQLEQNLRAVPGLRDVTNSAASALPELRIQVDQTRASQLGINTTAIGSAVRTAYAGAVATKYRRPDGRQIDVRVVLGGVTRGQTAALADLPVPTTGGGTVPLGQVASISEVTTPLQIDRRDRRRVATVSANLEPGVVQSQVTPQVARAVAQLPRPVGYTVTVGGQAEQQNTSFGQLGAALGVSILLAYLLMAILYNSLVHPLVILFGLPMAAGGAIIATALFRYSFNLFSMIGLILLVGLAIKNGILLVDRTNANRERGLSREQALLEAGPARLRAILMTSLTIAVSLIPSAFQLGEGAELRAPLAATVLGGVISSTLLTLLVVPIMYTLLDGLTTRLTGLRRLRVPRPFRPRPATLRTAA